MRTEQNVSGFMTPCPLLTCVAYICTGISEVLGSLVRLVGKECQHLGVLLGPTHLMESVVYMASFWYQCTMPIGTRSISTS